ncbi:sulfatase [Paraglaciecola aquimarina]|uniref:Sulfatase n=1 Tax=Paraglaciecola aquimarina TaxID=1235557 RepID=A0ABU3SY10_9ALTE|nr:sulfatase [Paraglaciecola aquimarina]MDU0354896.1 sulfatase [Paraglaciecola aquimarina]
MIEINRSSILRHFFGCLMLTVCTASAVAAEQPSILFILSDDAGYGDFGFQGSKEFRTPNLDKLAKESVKFEQAYTTAAVCGPSRAGLLTGKYQQRFGFEENNVPGYMSFSGRTGNEMGLPLEQKTIANYLKERGYSTGLFGKWHQGDALQYHPMNRGFDKFVGFRSGARSYYEMSNEEQTAEPEKRLERGIGQFEEPTKYLTDLLADETIAFMTENKSTPFFAYLSFNAVHTPMQARPEHLKLYPNLTGKRQTLAAMTHAMDLAIARVLKSLQDLGLDKNTIVVYTNDNGGPSDTNHSNNFPLSGSKANHLEGGIRVPMLIRWPNVLQANSTYPYPVSFLDFVPTFVDLAGGDADAINGLDGVNLIPYLTGEKTSRPHKTLFWKKENRGAVRDGDWKLLRFPDRPAELYNIAQDQSELNNLANQYPDRVKAMYQQLFNWELTLERPLWQLRREYEGKAMKRMDKYKQTKESMSQ